MYLKIFGNIYKLPHFGIFFIFQIWHIYKLPHLAVTFQNLAHTTNIWQYLQVATFGIFLFSKLGIQSTSCHNWHLFISQIWKFCETGSEVGYLSSVQAFCPIAESATTGNFCNRQFWELQVATSAAEVAFFTIINIADFGRFIGHHSLCVWPQRGHQTCVQEI